MTSASEWNSRYLAASPQILQPCDLLQHNAHLLPSTGIALELASGLGANALFLAQHGLITHAWDHSEVALQKLAERAQEQQCPIHTSVRDVVLNPPPAESFDVIVVAHFLTRSIAKALMDALKPQGLLFYQTFTRTCVSETGPKCDEYRLADNELLQLFQALKLVFYREEARIGNLQQGFRDKAQLIAQRV
ncbi:Tellurite resistance protein TehB [Beggiatoa alba B18LD]|uniref:Tellurite resistance protein TehB n=1 Tax=Beggiatoa alba B18LD TaxID=395493 RepID=I3CGM8_9GAMM|nr:class I SAM-dependent methyltransferase [Beggiatoa alba]EIJ42771.1 Tellurite resistance protein TehB [Beggiatoa alba B18LD]